MIQIIDEADWSNHPFLSKLIVSSDFDGWDKYLNISNPSHEDQDLAKKVIIEYRIDGGQWLASKFIERQAFISWVSFAWDYDGPLQDAAGSLIEWRAVINE